MCSASNLDLDGEKVPILLCGMEAQFLARHLWAWAGLLDDLAVVASIV